MTPFTITGYSTGLFATWYLIEEPGILFDAGDGVSAGLTQKAGKIKQVFISHADRDHITGLLQLNQLNARPGFPKIYYPEDSNSFPALRDFCIRFDPQRQGSEWYPVTAGAEIVVGKEWLVKPLHNGHIVSAGDLTKSLSYILYRVKHKLRPQYAGMDGQAIAALRKKLGDPAVTEKVLEPLLAYSGDTPVTHDNRFEGVQILIHEATFLEKAELAGADPRYNVHSTLEEVMEMAAAVNPESLILGHFSSRYSDDEILNAVRKRIAQHGIGFPVHVLLPGKMMTDILRQPPVS